MFYNLVLMPTLNWSSKEIPKTVPAYLQKLSVVYPNSEGYPPTDNHSFPDNSVILGDNLAVMSALLPDYEGKIDLIYADPPFYSNRIYSTRVGRGEDSRRPQDWKLAEGYIDSWPDIDSYLDMLYPRLHLMHRLLSPTGTMYLHLDWHANSYARLLLDEIFLPENLLNEIIWVYHGPSPIKSAFNRKHDTILVYTKGKKYTFNADAVRQPYNPNTYKTFASSQKAGFGKIPDLDRGKVPEDWWYFPVVARLHKERTGYPTQKPYSLLERIILASSNQGDLIADFFCGAGTTAIAAQNLDRKYIVCDNNWRAIFTTRSRLINADSHPFLLEKESQTALTTHEYEHTDHFSINPHELSFEKSSVDEVDFWEIDPAWDGQLFRSAAQSIRPRSQESLSTKLQFPSEVLQGTICVRFVSINGELYQAQLPVSAA